MSGSFRERASYLLCNLRVFPLKLGWANGLLMDLRWQSFAALLPLLAEVR